MAPRDLDEDADDADEKYHESSDEDFNPEAAPPEDVSSSEDEDGQVATKPVQRKGKRKAPDDEELDSGDEVTIQAARRKRSKKNKKKGAKDDDDALILSEDEGGEGGLIKTRAQRRGEQKERRPLARTEGATVDVDALWAQMTAAPLKPLQPTLPQESTASKCDTSTTTTASLPTEEEDQIPIRKVYTFAGQDTTEEKSIPRSHLSKYLSTGWKTLDATTTTTPPPTSDTPIEQTITPPASKIRRPLRRPTRFDPNPTGYIRALAPEHQLFWPRQPTTTTTLTQTTPQDPSTTMPPPDLPTATKPQKATKLNVVDKSRMDWTGFVDKEGIGEELDTHGKTKEAYLGRMEFLAGVEARREEERLKGRVKAAGVAAAVVQ